MRKSAWLVLMMGVGLLGGLGGCGLFGSEVELSPEPEKVEEVERVEEIDVEIAPAEPALPPPPVLAPPPPPPPVFDTTEENVPEFGHLEYADEVPEPPQELDELAMLVPDAARPGRGRSVRVAVLHGRTDEETGIGVAILIDIFRSKALEQDLGMPVKVIFISQMDHTGPRTNLIRYRDGAMQAAMQVARHLPLNQTLEPMTPQERRQAGLDLIVYIGTGIH